MRLSVIFATVVIATALLAPGCQEFEWVANQGACDVVDCSGHGTCRLEADVGPICDCDPGYCVLDRVQCVSVEGDSDADTDADIDTDTDADTDSGTDSCPVAVINLEMDPGDIVPLEYVLLDGTQSYRGGPDVTFHWYLTEAPPSSQARFDDDTCAEAIWALETCSRYPHPRLFVDLAGTYELCLEVCEVGGRCTSEPGCSGDTCVRFDAVPRDAIHIEVVWDHPETDLDLHYVRQGAFYGDRETQNPGGDCHYFNPHPDYCKPGDDADDPSLDIDDVRGYGPEMVGHNDPCDGRYRIWVSYHEDKGEGSTVATVRVRLKGMLVSETSFDLPERNCHWLVGEVVWEGDSGVFEPAHPQAHCMIENPEDGGSCIDDGDCGWPAFICYKSRCRCGCATPGSPVQCSDEHPCEQTTGRCEGAGECTSDSDCDPPNTICDTESVPPRCMPSCLSVGCPGAKACDPTTGHCKDRCASDSDCNPPTTICEHDVCMLGCGEPGGLDCGNSDCIEATGRCDTANHCTTDDDCNPPMTKCDEPWQICVDGCGLTGCDDGYVCENETGECVYNPCDHIGCACTSSADCQQGLFCEALSKKCTKSCTTDADCAPYYCGVNGFCE